MPTHPLFSILIANYNNGKYLMDAINSVRQQTYTNWEIIIVDDCSTDNSREVYQALEQDPQIRICYNEQNHGCGYTKRRCAELAQGELCGFLDPDDALLPDALEVMVKAHAEHPDASLISSRYNLCQEDFTIIWTSPLHSTEPLGLGCKENYLEHKEHHAEPLACYKREALRGHESISPNILRAVDMDLYFKLEEQGKWYFIDKVLYNYRLFDGSLSVGHHKAVYWHIKVAEAAALRRGLTPEDVVDNIISNTLKPYQERCKQLSDSKYYKFGYAIIHPMERVIRKIRKLCKK